MVEGDKKMLKIHGITEKKFENLIDCMSPHIHTLSTAHNDYHTKYLYNLDIYGQLIQYNHSLVTSALVLSIYA